MKKYEGKTLLMLGSNIASEDIVRYARENGAYTIVADYFPPERSPAKLAADEHVLISTTDMEKLSRLIQTRRVDGVLSGISEFNIQKAMELAEMNHLPFYCDLRQWHMIEEKHLFRTLCEMHGVPCPKTYFIGREIDAAACRGIRYPAILKPVDASTSAGISICANEQELLAHVPEALEHSHVGRIIVEEFVSGDEFTAHYTIANGKVTLACMDFRYPVAVHEGRVTTIPAARIYPSPYLEPYLRQVDPSMRSLCKYLKLQDGILFVQGLYDSDTDEFHIFEAGLRSAAEAPYRILREINGVDAMQVLVDHALSVPTDFPSELEDPFLHGKWGGVVSMVGHGGVVGSIEGLEEAVAATPGVISYESRYPVGSRVPSGDTLRQIMIRFIMICDSREQLAQEITYLNEHITVLNDQGENMVVRFDPERIFDIK